MLELSWIEPAQRIVKLRSWWMQTARVVFTVPAIFGNSLFQTSRSLKLKAGGESSSPFPRHVREPYIPRGPMRPTVRPFKIEFKSRSSRSTPMRPPTGDDAGKDRATPSFLDVGAFAAGRNSHANEYQAARKAADAVFGRSVPAAPAPETVPSFNAPMGRVLPSLIENGDALVVRLAETDEKPRRKRARGRVKAASPVRPKKPILQPESAVAEVSVEQPPTSIPPDTSIATASERERRSLKKRRLLDADLKAGEKWKRRLCEAAR
ncbi:MAG: hypothetical protein ABSD90_17875 [Methylocystis sp.]